MYVILDTGFNPALFFGRFHPLIVHLPIGFFLLALVFIVLEQFYKKRSFSQSATISLLLGGLSALLSVLFGWLLASDGGYGGPSLVWHRWLGVSVALIGLVFWLYRYRSPEGSFRVNISLTLVLLILLLVTGHLGGNLTHGSTYLTQYAPGFIKKLAGSPETVEAVNLSDKPVDSIYIYTDLIEPILATNCMRCHQDGTTKGGLNMSTHELLLEGGDNGAVVSAGEGEESEMIRRVVLPLSSELHMPPQGNPLHFHEINIIKWWIEQGASDTLLLTQAEIPEEIHWALQLHYDLDATPKPYIETVSVSPPDSSLLASLRKSGIRVQTLSQKNGLLDVSLHDSVTTVPWGDLEKIQDKITWLQLAEKQVQDEDLAKLGAYEHLTRLRLENNQIEGSGLVHLKELKHLSSLNLYGNPLQSEALTTVAALPSLKNVYLWQTQVSREAVDQLASQRPKLAIDTGVALTVNPLP